MSFKRLHILPFILLILFSCSLYAQSGWPTSGGAKFCGVVSHGGFISLQPLFTDTISYWETSTDSVTWTNSGTKNSSIGYNGGLTQTTYYRVVFQNAAHPPSDTSISAVSAVTVYQPTVAGSISGGGTFCTGGGALLLTGYTGSILGWLYSIDTGKTWTSVLNTTPHFNYNITQNTIFEAVVQNTSYCAVDSSSTATVNLSPSVAGTVTGGGVFCDSAGSGTLHLTGNVGNVKRWQYSTNGGSSWDTVANSTDSLKYTTITKGRLYEAVVQLGTCPADSTLPVSFIINRTLPGAMVNTDTTISYNDNNSADVLHLTGNVGNVQEWQFSTDSAKTWTTINNTTINQTFSGIVKSTLYRAVVKYGSCKSDTSGSVYITVLPKSIGKITNLFTPNGDGINDTWFVEGLNNYDDNEVSIYNIYGNVVYTKKAYKNDWGGTYNGAALPDGTYYYVITFDDSATIIKGSVDILK